MPNLSIKNVPPEVVGKLRERAAANHRSIQGELMALVTRAVSEPPTGVDEGLARQVRLGYKSIERIAAEHRARLKRPIGKGGRALDLGAPLATFDRSLGLAALNEAGANDKQE
jgi:plasmid stability protein